MSEVNSTPSTFITDMHVAHDMALAQAPYQEAAIDARKQGLAYEERVARNMAEAVSIVAGRAAVARLHGQIYTKTDTANRADLTFDQRVDLDVAEVARVNAGRAAIARLSQQVESGEPSRQQFADV